MGVTQGAAPGEMGRGSHGIVPDRCARPRSRHPRGTGARRQWQDSGAARQDDRQSRRLHVDVLVIGADVSLRHAAVGPIRYSVDLLRSGRGLYQHRAGRRLSRRRAARGDLRGRAAGGSSSPSDGHRAHRTAQAQLHQDIPASDPGDHGLRRRRLSGLDEEGAGDRRREGFRQAQARSGAPRQAARPWLFDLYRSLRHRACRKRSVRSAPASACGNPPKCGSIRPARSKC